VVEICIAKEATMANYIEEGSPEFERLSNIWEAEGKPGIFTVSGEVFRCVPRDETPKFIPLGNGFQFYGDTSVANRKGRKIDLTEIKNRRFTDI
jgi:hypothetical protein